MDELAVATKRKNEFCLWHTVIPGTLLQESCDPTTPCNEWWTYSVKDSVHVVLFPSHRHAAGACKHAHARAPQEVGHR